MVVEIILQLLVCIVDTELLEAVGLKVLKAKNVQNTDGQTLKNSKNRNEYNTGKFITGNWNHKDNDKMMFWQIYFVV